MNCKQGDLAIIVRCTLEPSANGKIVRCVSSFVIDGHVGWEIDPFVKVSNGYYSSVVDRLLRPIRDPGDDAVDEIVRLVGKPEMVTA